MFETITKDQMFQMICKTEVILDWTNLVEKVEITKEQAVDIVKDADGEICIYQWSYHMEVFCRTKDRNVWRMLLYPESGDSFAEIMSVCAQKDAGKIFIPRQI